MQELQGWKDILLTQSKIGRGRKSATADAALGPLIAQDKKAPVDYCSDVLPEGKPQAKGR